jgi:uncharacterized Zn finger protein
LSRADLKPCPSCGKRGGELKTLTGARFPYFVRCRECGLSTEAVRLDGVAVKLWNEAKKPAAAKAKR